MANATPPKRLKWPFGAYQWKLLDDMIEELYRRVFALETTPSTTTVSSGSGSGSSIGSTVTIQPPETVSVDDIDGLLGEMVSFMGHGSTSSGAAPPSTVNMAVIMTRVVLGI